MPSTRVKRPLYTRKRVMLPAAALIALVAVGSRGTPSGQSSPGAPTPAAQDTEPHPSASPSAAPRPTPAQTPISPPAAPQPTPEQTSVSPEAPTEVAPPQAPTTTTVPPARPPAPVETEPPAPPPVETEPPAPPPVETEPPAPPPAMTAGAAPAPRALPPPDTTSADPDETAFANCRELNAVYPHGVGLPGAHDRSRSGTPVTSFMVSWPVYSANTGRDGDHDGIACERR